MCRKELFRLLPIDLYFKKVYKSLSLAGYQTKSALSVGEFLVQIVRIWRKKKSTGDIFSETQFWSPFLLFINIMMILHVYLF